MDAGLIRYRAGGGTRRAMLPPGGAVRRLQAEPGPGAAATEGKGISSDINWGGWVWFFFLKLEGENGFLLKSLDCAPETQDSKEGK